MVQFLLGSGKTWDNFPQEHLDLVTTPESRQRLAAMQQEKAQLQAADQARIAAERGSAPAATSGGLGDILADLPIALLDRKPAYLDSKGYAGGIPDMSWLMNLLGLAQRNLPAITASSPATNPYFPTNR
jgi:hypothetical protein